MVSIVIKYFIKGVLAKHFYISLHNLFYLDNKDWLKNNSLIYIFKDVFRPLRVIFTHLWEHLNEKSINLFFAGDTNNMYYRPKQMLL